MIALATAWQADPGARPMEVEWGGFPKEKYADVRFPRTSPATPLASNR
jgi:hypothetical protein